MNAVSPLPDALVVVVVTLSEPAEAAKVSVAPDTGLPLTSIARATIDTVPPATTDTESRLTRTTPAAAPAVPTACMLIEPSPETAASVLRPMLSPKVHDTEPMPLTSVNEVGEDVAPCPACTVHVTVAPAAGLPDCVTRTRTGIADPASADTESTMPESSTTENTGGGVLPLDPPGPVELSLPHDQAASDANTTAADVMNVAERMRLGHTYGTLTLSAFVPG